MYSYLSLLILSFLYLNTAQAVQTKKCPNSLNVSVSKVQKFSRSFVNDQIESLEADEEYGESVNLKSVEFFLGNEEVESGFNLNFELGSKRNSNCYYKSQDLWGGAITAKITGTDADPKLTLELLNNKDSEDYTEIVMFADAISKKPTYSFAGSTLQIKTTAVMKDWGESYIAYIPVGKAQITEDPDFKYLVSPETWSIELLLDTCKDKLESAIQDAVSGLGGDPKDSVYVLPKHIGYKFFTVTLKAKDGNLVLPQDEIQYEFEYKTLDDNHTQCTDVQPHDLVY